MAGANPKTNATEAAKVEKLEAELKTAFKDGKFETVRKKVEDIRKVDPENRLAKRILEKVQEEEAEEMKRANASKIKVLESKMDQAFKTGDLPGMDRLMGEVKRLDPKNRKMLGYEMTIEKAKQSLQAEMKREKIQKLVAEVEFFVNKADWGGAGSKANELLALEWSHPVAMRAFEKAAKAKRVRPETLITVKAPKIEAKPGFFAHLFAKKPEVVKAKEAPKVSVLDAVSKPIAPVAKPVTPVSVAKSAVAEVKPVVQEVKKVEPVKAVPAKVEPKKESKPGFFAKLFAKKPEVVKAKEAPKVVALKPVLAKPAVAEVKPVVKTVVVEVAKPVAKPVVQEVKKAEPVKAAPAKVEPKKESKPGFFAKLFAKKSEAVKAKEAPKAVLQPSLAVPKFSTLASMLDTKPMGPSKEAPVPSVPMKSEVSILKPLVVPPVAPKPVTESKPVVAEMAALKPESSIFGSLFAKKEEPKVVAPAPKPVMPLPVMHAIQTPKAVEAPALAPTVLKPVLSMPLVQKAPETQLKVEQKSVARPETNVPEKGNIFTSLFGSEEVESKQKPATSVLETIVAKTAPAKGESKAEKVPEISTGEGLLAFASAFLKFAVVFILVSAAFLVIENMDTGNTVLKLVNKENNAIQLHNADESLATQKVALDSVNKDINKYKGGYQDESQKTIDTIIANRMDWPALLAKLNEVTESVYAKNAISQYVQYNNYSYDAEKGQLLVAGTLSDPLGKNLTKLAELEQAFRNYPKDPSNPNDDRKPYFYGLAGFNSYSKSLNSATGRFQSTFSLSLSTKEKK